MTELRTFDRRPWLILCEGESDKRFLHQLIAVRQIADDFQIRFPSRGKDNRGGRSKFGAWLDTAKDVGGWDNIRAVLLISDNDEDPQKSLEEVKTSLRDAAGFPVPSAERTVAKAVGFPRVVILMLPPGNKGSLETLCLSAAYDKWPIVKTPLDALVSSVGTNKWSANKESKMRLQTIIASTCEGRPDAGFVGHWWESYQYHLPLGHKVFDDIAAFLTGFRALITAA